MELLVKALGGLGLFLLGLTVMTDGLKGIAGDKIRRSLMTFTRSPITGVISGATSTALLQSSSATTVAAVGFVAAGLMSFTEALGIILGANIGSTITGWLVALVGFKFKIGDIALPLILLGALLRIFSRDTWAAIGSAFAGFGLIFVGIEYLQDGMGGLQGIVSFDSLPADSLLGRLQLVFIGVVFTIITQSSGAGVAATLVAIYTGMINFEQGAALVIGMDIGTTVTAFMATLGGTVGAKRTGYSHVIYNVITGTCAVFLITPYVSVWEYFAPGALLEHAEIAVVAFHSSFNILGVIIVLPFIKQFAELVIRLVPEKQNQFTENLQREFLDHPELALDIVHSSLMAIYQSQLNRMVNFMKDSEQTSESQDLEQALLACQQYIDEISFTNDARQVKRMVELIHCLDHMQRLMERCVEEKDRFDLLCEAEALQTERQLLLMQLDKTLTLVTENDWSSAAKLWHHEAKQFDKGSAVFRSKIITGIVNDMMGIGDGSEVMEAYRWLQHVERHHWRICSHMYHAAVDTALEDTSKT